MRKKLAVFCSGSGSNFEAIFQATQRGEIKAEIDLLICDSAEIGAVQRARKFGIPYELIECSQAQGKFPLNLQEKVKNLLIAQKIDLICLAGWMRIIKDPLLHHFSNRILNIHPSLLPAFPGLKAWEQAFQAGVKITGCSVHYVDAGIDTGKIILQSEVERKSSDTIETLRKRIQEAEHSLYPKAIKKVLAQIEQSN